MKTKYLLLLALPIVANLSFAQKKEKPVPNFELEISEPYKVVDAPKKHYFQRGSEILSVKIRGKLVTIQKFDAAGMTETAHNEFKDFPKGFDIESVANIKDKYYIFFSLWDKKAEMEQLFYREIDFENATISNEDVLVMQIEGKVTGSPVGTVGGWWSVGVTDKFDFKTSFDDSKLLVQYRMKPKEKRDSKNRDEIGLFVYDNNMNKIWGEEVTMPYTEKDMDNLDYGIDSKGNAYILAAVRNAGKQDKKNTHRIELLRLAVDQKEIETIPVELTDMYINTINLYETGGDNMVCAGYYSKKGKYGADGVFTFRANANGEIYDVSIHEIPVEVLNANIGKRAAKKNEKKDKKDKLEFENLTLRNFHTYSDGSVSVIGEQYYVIEHRSTSSNGTTTTTYTYYYNDILFAKINAANELAWMKKLPKRQKGSKGLGAMSFKYIFSGNKHYLLYLDNLKNFELEYTEVPKFHQDGMGGFLTAYRMDDNGEIEKLLILDMKNVNGKKIYQFVPSKIMALNENEIIFEAYMKKKQDAMVKVNLAKQN